MFERFTDATRHNLVVAGEEARDRGHNFIGSEHLLLGLFDDAGLGGDLVRELGVERRTFAAHVDATIGNGSATPSVAKPPFTPKAKKALELALREALQLGHNRVSTEHLLLALVRGQETVAGTWLHEAGADLDLLRKVVAERSAISTGPPPRRRFPRRTGKVIDGGVQQPAATSAARATSPLDATAAVEAALAGATAAADAAEAQVDSRHLLLGLAEQAGSAAAQALAALGVTPEQLRAALDEVDVASTTEASEVFESLTVTAGELTLTIDDLDLVAAVLEGLRALAVSPAVGLDEADLAPGTTTLALPGLEAPLRTAVALWLEDLAGQA